MAAPEVGPVQALGRCDPVLPSLQTAAPCLGFGAQFSLSSPLVKEGLRARDFNNGNK